MNWNSSNHPISDLRDWNNDKKLEIRPDFQRREVWSKAAKIMLIDTIIRNIPMPKLYIETLVNNRGTYRIVIDGQQRITAILGYLNDEYAMPTSYTFSQEWRGKKFSEVTPEMQNIFLNYQLNINNLVNPTEEEVRDLYSRVNKYTVQLNKQELRRADYPGNFINLAEKLVRLNFFDEARIFSAAMTRRMKDVEFIEELMMILLEGMQDKKKKIDDFCERYKHMDKKEEFEKDFKAIISDISLLFTDEKGRMYISNTRFNQLTDFYTIFAVIAKLKADGKIIDKGKTLEVQKMLDELNEKIRPYSNNQEYSEYALHCTSDANSLVSRKWRYEFMLPRIEVAYD